MYITIDSQSLSEHRNQRRSLSRILFPSPVSPSLPTPDPEPSWDPLVFRIELSWPLLAACIPHALNYVQSVYLSLTISLLHKHTCMCAQCAYIYIYTHIHIHTVHYYIYIYIYIVIIYIYIYIYIHIQFTRSDRRVRRPGVLREGLRGHSPVE